MKQCRVYFCVIYTLKFPLKVVFRTRGSTHKLYFIIGQNLHPKDICLHCILISVCLGALLQACLSHRPAAAELTCKEFVSAYDKLIEMLIQLINGIFEV